MDHSYTHLLDFIGHTLCDCSRYSSHNDDFSKHQNTGTVFFENH